MAVASDQNLRSELAHIITENGRKKYVIDAKNERSTNQKTNTLKIITTDCPNDMLQMKPW